MGYFGPLFFLNAEIFQKNKLMSVEVTQIIDAISHEKGIDRKILIDAIEAAMLSAAGKRFDPELELSVTFNESRGEAELFILKEVVRTVKNPDTEITLKDARKIDPEVKRGDKVQVFRQTESLGRVAVLNAKQIILQKVREAESDTLYNHYKDKINDIVSGIVLRMERGDIIVDLGKIEGILPRREQVSSEKFKRHDRIKAYVIDIKKGAKGVFALLSRTHPVLLTRLFEIEVPEINEGIIEIKGVAREPSGRSKIAVKSTEKDVDPVGACVGIRGSRVQSIVSELMGEKIDIVEWSEDISSFVTNALSPAKIAKVNLRKEEKSIEVIVPDDQLSLAIGKRGQNVRLASNLLKWRIDIKGQNQLRLEAEEKESKDVRSKDFLMAALREREEIGEDAINLLLENNLETIQAVIKKGKEGLQEAGVNEEKAALIIDLVEEKDKEFKEREKELAESRKMDEEEAREQEKLAEPVPGAKEEEKEEEAEIIENIEEHPIEKLPGIADADLKKLKSAGYQTIAEISGAEVEELVDEGLEKEEAEKLLDEAVKFIELHEKN